MIGKSTRLFALMGENLSANRLYQMYNYIFEVNGVDAAFINMSVPAGKMEFTLQNLGQSQFEVVLIDGESANLPDLLNFFGKTEGCVSKIFIQNGNLAPVFAPFADSLEDEILESARLNFFEWLGYYPKLPDDVLNTLKESAPRESILTRE